LHLRAVVEGLSEYPVGTLATCAVAATAVVVGTRLVWFFTVRFRVTPAATDHSRIIPEPPRQSHSWL
jgi:hypothetical protein